MTATAQLLPPPRAVFYDGNGNPLSGGLVHTYVPGGTAPAETWQDSGETTPNAQPIVLDAAGSALIYGSGDYSFVVTDSSGNNIPAYSGLTQTLDVSGPTITLTNITNIATLRANTATTPNVYWVDGYYNNADGGEGFFILMASDTTSADNGGTILVDAAGNRWYRETGGLPLNCRWFGAAGGGVGDDTSALQAMLNVGNAWYIPPGTYNFSALTIPFVVGFDFGGAGQSSVLVQTGGGIAFPNLATGIFGASATIHDLSFNGAAGTAATLNMTFAQEYRSDQPVPGPKFPRAIPHSS